MSILLCCIDWNAISAISNIIMAFAAFLSIGFSIYLFNKDRKQRKEDMRARIDFSIIKYMHGYYLRIENVGKETAYDINMKVHGLPIDDNLYYFVKQVFYELTKKRFILKGGDKLYFYISPSILEKEIPLPWKEKKTIDEINNWLKEYDEKPIVVTGQFNNRYAFRKEFTIRNFNVLGSFQIPDSLDSIARVISDMDTYTLGSIKDQLQNISDNFNMK